MASLNLAPAPEIHSNRAVQIVFLLTEEVEILEEYSDFIDIFLEQKALMLTE